MAFYISDASIDAGMQNDFSMVNPRLASFRDPNYLHINRARLDHLDSLGLPLAGRRILELGSGPGDLTGFLLERNCHVASVDGRAECLEALQQRFPQVETLQLDLNSPEALSSLGVFDAVHCYGLLYHIEQPARLIDAMGEICNDFAVIETCLAAGSDDGMLFAEETSDYTQSLTLKGCRPTRSWMFHALRQAFPFVYLTVTQPDHPEFPIDWDVPLDHLKNIRSVFVASRQEIHSPMLSSQLIYHQKRFAHTNSR
jgi:SAM-dependent methyltransferase